MSFKNVFIQGAELTNMGQASKLGKYMHVKQHRP